MGKKHYASAVILSFATFAPVLALARGMMEALVGIETVQWTLGLCGGLTFILLFVSFANATDSAVPAVLCSILAVFVEGYLTLVVGNVSTLGLIFGFTYLITYITLLASEKTGAEGGWCWVFLGLIGLMLLTNMGNCACAACETVAQNCDEFINGCI
jgi:hypothetical protein